MLHVDLDLIYGVREIETAINASAVCGNYTMLY
jgi:hypothetical protein